MTEERKRRGASLTAAVQKVLPTQGQASLVEHTDSPRKRVSEAATLGARASRPQSLPAATHRTDVRYYKRFVVSHASATATTAGGTPGVSPAPERPKAAAVAPPTTADGTSALPGWLRGTPLEHQNIQQLLANGEGMFIASRPPLEPSLRCACWL